MFLCAIVLFGWYRRLRKPTFVWVMWAFFVISEAAMFTDTILYHELTVAKPKDKEKIKRLTEYYDDLFFISTVTLMSGHWVFGIKYAEVVPKLPLLLFPDKAVDIKARLKKITIILWALNSIFAALVLV